MFQVQCPLNCFHRLVVLGFDDDDDRDGTVWRKYSDETQAACQMSRTEMQLLRKRTLNERLVQNRCAMESLSRPAVIIDNPNVRV